MEKKIKHKHMWTLIDAPEEGIGFVRYKCNKCNMVISKIQKPTFHNGKVSFVDLEMM